MKITDEIIHGIKITIAPVMDEWVKNKVRFAMETKAWWKSYKRTGDIYRDYNNLYERIGKTEWNHINFLNEAQIVDFYKKEAEHRMLKIDTAVTKKIKDADQIVSIECLHLGQGYDGFVEGNWRLTMKDGSSKVFGWKTLIAGGWNIQCLHVRSKYIYK